MKILELWFQGARTKDEREKVHQDIALAHNAFKRLKTILEGKIKDDTKFEDYNIANWPYLQADLNGYNRAIKEILKTIEVKE